MPGNLNTNPLYAFVDAVVCEIKFPHYYGVEGDRNICDGEFTITLDANMFTFSDRDIIQNFLDNPIIEFTFDPPPSYGSATSNRNIWDIMSEGKTVPNNLLLRKFIKYIYDKYKIIYTPYGNEFIDMSACDNSYHVVSPQEVAVFDRTQSLTANIPIASYRDDSVWGTYNRNGDKGWFPCDDAVEDGCSGEYYIDETVANLFGIEWRECCEQYWSDERDDCCNEYANQNRATGETFDSTYYDVYKPNPTFIQLTKTSGMDYTFGVELETCSSSEVYNGSHNLKAVYDGSVSGHEFVTGVLQGNKGVDELKSICNHLSGCDARVDRTCGVHVHIGNATFNRRFSIMLLKLCLHIQDDIYSILPESRLTNEYCKRLPAEQVERLDFHNYRKVLGTIIANCDINKDYNKKKAHPGGRYHSQRYYWVNISNYSTSSGTSTVEFRPHSGSLDFNKIYKWLLICMAIVKFAENQQRRIWMSYMTKPITLHEVLKYSLTNDLYVMLTNYCNQRARRFGNTFRY